jgi:hypothetical protein
MAFFSPPPLSLFLSFFRLIANSLRRGCRRVLKFLHGLLSNKNIRILTKKNIRGLPLPPSLCNFWVENGGILKSCTRVPKLKI